MFHNETVRCIQITDIHLDPEEREPQGVPAWDQFIWALDTCRGMNPDLVFITGDLALNEGSAPIYHALASLLDRAGGEVVLLPGNHDRRDLFHEAFGRRYRLDENRSTLDAVIETRGRRMLLLDSADAVIHDHSLAWLDALLESFASARKQGAHSGSVIVWTHHPPLGGFHRFMDRYYPLRNGEAFLDVCRRYRDTLHVTLFCGHYHTEHSGSRDNVTQHCTPSTWAQLDPETEDLRPSSTVPAIRVVDLDEMDRVTTTVIEPA
ncbi:MAG: hypothetical protein EA427_06765 [Spirochaetaceae bacterium]|nr:MAG: hypothetical protein EA427_06765 [Spirochaetaceae bacterium]